MSRIGSFFFRKYCIPYNSMKLNLKSKGENDYEDFT